MTTIVETNETNETSDKNKRITLNIKSGLGIIQNYKYEPITLNADATFEELRTKLDYGLNYNFMHMLQKQSGFRNIFLGDFSKNTCDSDLPVKYFIPNQDKIWVHRAGGTCLQTFDISIWPMKNYNEIAEYSTFLNAFPRDWCFRVSLNDDCASIKTTLGTLFSKAPNSFELYHVDHIYENNSSYTQLTKLTAYHTIETLYYNGSAPSSYIYINFNPKITDPAMEKIKVLQTNRVDYGQSLIPYLKPVIKPNHGNNRYKIYTYNALRYYGDANFRITDSCYPTFSKVEPKWFEIDLAKFQTKNLLGLENNPNAEIYLENADHEELSSEQYQSPTLSCIENWLVENAYFPGFKQQKLRNSLYLQTPNLKTYVMPPDNKHQPYFSTYYSDMLLEKMGVEDGDSVVITMRLGGAPSFGPSNKL